MIAEVEIGVDIRGVCQEEIIPEKGDTVQNRLVRVAVIDENITDQGPEVGESTAIAQQADLPDHIVAVDPATEDLQAIEDVLMIEKSPAVDEDHAAVIDPTKNLFHGRDQFLKNAQAVHLLPATAHIQVPLVIHPKSNC